MSTQTNTNKIHLFIFLFVFSFLLAACDGCQAPTKDILAEFDPMSTLEIQKQFYHAWLADCVNDLSYDEDSTTAQSDMLAKAQERLAGATRDPNIAAVIGKEKIVWGPILVAGQQQNSGYYVSDNLLYCIESTTTSGIPYYAVGIAGTNMISPFDWSTEDFEVGKQVSWETGGNISQGTSIGFHALNGFKDNSGMTLVDFLISKVSGSPSSVVTVAGHSLGGALTEVYAAFLKNKLKSHGTQVHTYVYGGPTAGDATFATAIVKQLDGYYAFRNSLDVVPHAWQNNRLNEVCGLYDGKSMCGSTISSNPAVNGLIKFLNKLSENGNYTVPGTPTSFTGNPTAFDRCDLLSSAIDVYWEGGNLNSLYSYLNGITKLCNNGKEITEDQFLGFFYFFVEMGGQHTTAYFNHFLGNESADFQDAVNKYVPGAGDPWENAENLDEGIRVLEAFLGQVFIGLSPNAQDCSCKSAS